jgi:putative flippase GtrA
MQHASLKTFVREVGSYGAASFVALATDIGLLALLTSYAHVHYLVATILSFVAGGAVLYLLSVTLVFHFRRVRNRGVEISAFVALGIAGLIVNTAVIYVAVERAHLHLMVSKLLASGCTFGVNFLLRRHFLFTPREALATNAINPGA